MGPQLLWAPSATNFACEAPSSPQIAIAPGNAAGDAHFITMFRRRLLRRLCHLMACHVLAVNHNVERHLQSLSQQPLLRVNAKLDIPLAEIKAYCRRPGDGQQAPVSCLHVGQAKAAALQNMNSSTIISDRNPSLASTMLKHIQRNRAQ
jgi:hypothetical protein